MGILDRKPSWDEGSTQVGIEDVILCRECCVVFSHFGMLLCNKILILHHSFASCLRASVLHP